MTLCLAQPGDEPLSAGRARPGHVAVTPERDLPGVSDHERILVIEGEQRGLAAAVKAGGALLMAHYL
jgi:hypothetical protein